MKKVLFLAVAVALALNANAQWSYDPSINTPVCLDSNGQFSVSIISDGAGGAIIAWQDDRNMNDLDIFAQRIDSAGIPLWNANGVAICNAPYDQTYPILVSDGAGGVIVTWEDFRNGVHRDVYAQRIDAGGNSLWTSNGVPIDTSIGFQSAPLPAADGMGGAYITWHDEGGADNDVFVQRVNSMGQKLWSTNGVPVCTAVNDQDYPSIYSNGPSGVFIAWWDRRSGSSGDIYAQFVDSAGNAQWLSDGVAIVTAPNDQGYPEIVSDGMGGAVISWMDYRSGSNQDVYCQRISGAGQIQWQTNGIPVCTAANDQFYPKIVNSGMGKVIVCWQDKRSGDNDIYAQQIDVSGMVGWTTDGTVVSSAPDNQGKPTIVADLHGGAIISWFDKRNGTDFDIFSQRIDSLGQAEWQTNGVPICTASESQYDPKIILNGSEGAIVAWYDRRSVTSNDVYVQNICLGGNIGGIPAPIGNIVGATNVCPGSSNNYSIPSVPGATSYNWTLPGGWSGSSTTNSITATADSVGGTVSVSAINDCGNSSPVLLTVSIVTIDTTTNTSLGTITSNQAGATYQWLDCDSGYFPIPGATAQSFSPLASGYYAVAIDLNGCADTSACIDVMVVGMEDEFSGIQALSVTIHPNPTQGEFSVETESVPQNIILTDLLGKTIFESRPSGLHTSLNLHHQNSGIYLLRVVSKKGSRTLKVVKTE